MKHQHLTLLRRLGVVVLAAAVGTGSAFVAAGSINRATAARPAARIGSRGQTAMPHLDRGSYLVQAGRALRVLVHAHAVWGHPRTCRLTVSRGGYHRAYVLRGVVADFSAMLRTSRNARQGTWRLTVGCTARRRRASRTRPPRCSSPPSPATAER